MRWVHKTGSSGSRRPPFVRRQVTRNIVMT
jgi:hypothetical protein